MGEVTFIVDGHETSSPPPGRRRTIVDIDERGNATVVINTASGPAPVLSPEIRAKVQAMRDGGESYEGIARWLNEEGVPTARGGPWIFSTVAYVLRARKR